MSVPHASSGIDLAANLQDFFDREIRDTIDRHRIDGEDDTVWYLTQLLCTYSRSSRFFDRGQGCAGTLTPLAFYYRAAVEASSDWERRQHLQRLGDVALFISSLFSGSLSRKPVDVDYYISMGESAYGALADAGPRSTRDRALADIFSDLATRFAAYVAALSEIPTRPVSSDSLMQQVLEWERTGQPELARQLRRQGVFLPSTHDAAH